MAKSLSSKIAAATAPKGLLSGLEFVEDAPQKPQRANVPMDPTQRVRSKMLEGVALQLEAVAHLVRGEKFEPTREVPVKGQRGVREAKPQRFTPWFWSTSDGTYFLVVKYGTRQVMIEGGKAIRVGKLTQLRTVLEVIQEAVTAGEMDEELLSISNKMGRKSKG
jgi:hypothetical protein